MIDIIEATDATDANKYIRSVRASRPSSHMVGARILNHASSVYNKLIVHSLVKKL